MPPSSYYEEEEFESKLDQRTFGRLLSLLKGHKKDVSVFLIAILFVAGLDSVFTFISKHIIDDAIIPRDPTMLVNLMILYSIFILVQAGMVYLFFFTAGIFGERIRYDLRKWMFDHLQQLSLSYYSRTPVGWIMSRVTSDSDRVADLLTWGLIDSSWALMSILTSLVFMLVINWKLALIVLGILPVLLIIAIEFRKRILKEYRNVRKTNSKIVGAYNENITGVRVVKALGRESENLKEFSSLTDRMFKSSYKAAWMSALFLPIVQIIAACALGAILWYGGSQVQNSANAMTIGGIQAFVSYVTFMMWPIQDLARVFAEMQHAIASAERIFSMLDSEPEVKNRKRAKDLVSLNGNIIFDHVNFSYSDAKDVPVIKDISLEIQPGETIALVGPTGGGKTTLVNLVCRFYEPTHGKILVNGMNYTNYTLDSIQSRIGVVLQTPHLFSGTIKENIRYGRLGASDEEILEASNLAGAHHFISNLPKGYEEEVGEGGNLLSVGQKQLISLARAILAKPEIFIMDEATSSVDTLTESLIQKGMEHLMRGRTTFIIAHRLSTIKRADRILVIEDGQIAETGSHASLLKQKGKYYHLYTKQFRFEMEESLGGIASAETPPA